MERAEFEELVRDALDDLPEEFAQRLENIQIVVEDEPEPTLLRSLGMHPHRDTLFGLYQGVPLAARGASFGNTLPDRITLYYGPLVHTFQTPARIRTQVRKTLIHEIAHFFGMNDAQIRKLGY